MLRHAASPRPDITDAGFLHLWARACYPHIKAMVNESNEPTGNEPWRHSELPEEQQAELEQRFAEAERNENLTPAKEALAAAKRLSDEICGMVPTRATVRHGVRPYTVEVLERAWRELAWENANWNLNLPRAKPDRLLAIFDKAVALLAEDPRIGPEDEENPGHRRILCRTGRVGFWLYYRVDDANEYVQVVSFWSAQRSPPELP